MFCMKLISEFTDLFYVTEYNWYSLVNVPCTLNKNMYYAIILGFLFLFNFFYPCLDLLKFHFYKMCLVEDLFCLGIVGLLKLVDY